MEVPQTVQYSVCGYCREIQSILSKDSFHCIPTTIIQIITSFYHEYEEWNSKYKSNTFKIQGNSIIKLTGKNSYSDTAYLSKIVFGGQHHWQFNFKIIKTSYIRIGIWKDDVTITDKHLNHTSLNKYPNTAYVFDGHARINYHIHKPHRYSARDVYGVKLTENGTIIDMFLNFNTLELSFAINGIYYGRSHSIDNCKYRAAISCRGQGTHIELLAYDTNSVECMNFNVPKEHIQIDEELVNDETDKWSSRYKAKTFVINDNIITKSIGNIGYSDSAYLSKIVYSGQHHWKFRLNVITTSFIRIGIWKNDVNITGEYINHCSLNKYANTAYIFDGCGRINYHNHKPTRYSQFNSYGVVLNVNGTIVDMFVNFDSLELSFAINGINYGKSHDIDDCKYRAAISCRGQGTQIELLSYKQNLVL